MAKQQMKNHSKVLISASIACFLINTVLHTTEAALAGSNGLLAQIVSLVSFCVSSLLPIAYFCVCVKLAKTNSASFSDFTDGLTLFKSGILGTLWHGLWIFLWSLIFIIPTGIITGLLFATVLTTKFNVTQIDPNNIPVEEIMNEVIRNISNYSGIVVFIILGFIGLCVVMIIKSIQYSQMTVILAEASLENRDMPVTKAMTLSIELTKGHKMKIFTFFLSFIGWYFVSLIPVILVSLFRNTITNSFIYALILTAAMGLSIAFITPYMATSFVNLYGHLKQQAINTKQLSLKDFE